MTGGVRIPHLHQAIHRVEIDLAVVEVDPEVVPEVVPEVETEEDFLVTEGDLSLLFQEVVDGHTALVVVVVMEEVEVKAFSGDGQQWIRDWQLEMTVYCQTLDIDESVWFRLFRSNLTGAAAQWRNVQDLRTREGKRHPATNWVEFVEELVQAFEPARMSDVARRTLRGLKQTGCLTASSRRLKLRLDWMPSLHPEPCAAMDVGAEAKTWVKNKVEVVDGVVAKAVDEVVVETKDEEEEAQIPNVLCVEKLDTSKVHVQKAKSSRNG
ncbi:hypothetical protein BSKO_02426 [Bryopsis sp. KO-2023]|nr:hypothetical protein BSKO_02426 [Bryopsis sp. KO-2023]